MFGSNIKSLREQRGLTQKQMSAETGININTLASYEKGTREPNFETLCKLAKYFECTTDFLLGLSNWCNEQTRLDAENAFEFMETSMGKIPLYRNKLYDLFQLTVEMIARLNVDPALQREVYGELLRILLAIDGLSKPIPLMHDIQAGNMKVESKASLEGIVENIMNLSSVALSGMIESVMKVTASFSRTIDFLCYGKIGGEKAVTTTMSAILNDLAELKEGDTNADES